MRWEIKEGKCLLEGCSSQQLYVQVIREERCLLSNPHRVAECYVQEVLACSRCAWKIDFTRSDDSETDDYMQTEYGNRYMQIVGALDGL